MIADNWAIVAGSPRVTVLYREPSALLRIVKLACNKAEGDTVKLILLCGTGTAEVLEG